MKSAISLILAVSVFSCPLLCHVGHVSAAAHIAAAGCCCHSSQPSNNDGPNGNPFRSHKSNSCCQGVCGGAVFNHVPSVPAAVDTSWSLPISLVEHALLTSLPEIQFNRFCTAPW